MDRKTELEIKKAKLDELRKQKAQRTNLTKTPSGNQLATPDNSQSSTLNDFDADKILIEFMFLLYFFLNKSLKISSISILHHDT